MTLTVGFRCMDGLVLCSDSLESDGLTKRFVNKVWFYEVQDNWGIAIASAGEADLADSFTESLRETLGNSDFDDVLLLRKLRLALKEIRITYPKAEFGFLAAVYGRLKLYQKLFRVLDGSMHLGPVNRYQTLGIASPIAEFLIANLYSVSMCVDECVRLSMFLMGHVYAHSNDVGGPVSVVSYKEGDTDFRLWSQDELTAIESEFPRDKFETLLRQFWKDNNPSPRFEHIKVRTGGGATRIKSAHLNTRP